MNIVPKVALTDDGYYVLKIPKRYESGKRELRREFPNAVYDEEAGGFILYADTDATIAIKRKLPKARWETRKVGILRRNQHKRFTEEQVKPSPEGQDKKVKNGLYRFQVTGVDFLVAHETALLADDMGLGKTIQSVVAAQRVASNGRKLVIVPNTLVENWLDEIEAWTPDDGQAIYSIGGGTPKSKRLDIIEQVANDDACWFVVSWEVMRLHATPQNKSKMQTDQALMGIPFAVVIADEAHRMKNRKSVQAQAIKRIPAGRKYALTGTPVMNRPDELWSMLNWMEPKNFRSYWDFFENYVDYYDGYFGKIIKGSKNVDQLARLLSTRMLRRTKPEVFRELPDKTYKTIYVPLSKAQQKAYDELAEFLITQLQDGEIVTAAAVLAKITRLKQICVSLGLLSDGVSDSAKIDALMELMDDTGGKVVVFSQFAKAIGLVHERLKKAKVPHVVMTGKAALTWDGESARVTRGELVKAFQKQKKYRVFLGTTQAGGVGITLTAANTVVFLDKMWTPADQVQAEDRLHRIGQKDNVYVVNLLTRGTVEEHIERTLNRKQSMIQEIMDKATRTSDVHGMASLLRRTA